MICVGAKDLAGVEEKLLYQVEQRTQDLQTQLDSCEFRVRFRPFLPRDASAERGDATVSRLSVRNVQVPYSNRFEFFENNFTAK